MVNTDSSLANQEEINSLRAELKEWEKTYSAANGDRKPGRDDIKKNPAIGMQHSHVKSICSRVN